MANQGKPILAFLVGPKNESQVINYIGTHFEDVSNFKLLVTETDQNGLEQFSNTGLDIQYVPSIEKKGDVEIASRASRGQVEAIVIINPTALSKQLTPERFWQLGEKAWASDVHVCLNQKNIDLVISQLISLRGISGKTGKKTKRVENKAMQQILLTRFPTFDDELPESEKLRRAKVEKWGEQQLYFWFETNNLNFFKPLLTEQFKNDKNNKDVVATEETQYFTRDDEKSNFFKLKCASLDKSIEYLTLGPDARIRDIFDYPLYCRDFLISHHEFTTSIELIRMLKTRYHAPAPPGTDPEEDHRPMNSINNILRDWILMEYASDFADNADLQNAFEDFVRTDIAKEDPDVAKELTEMLSTALQLSPPYPVDLTKAPRPFLPKKNKHNKFDFLSFNPTEVARQMTLMDEQLFHKVRAREFLGGGWAKKDAMSRAPNLTKFINHTNRMAAWVVTEILQPTSYELCSEYIQRFIRIGKELLEMRNYSGVMNILTALHSAPIGRLKNAWNLVPSKEKKDFEDLTDSLSLLGHYKNYRETVKNLPASTPCIPLIPVTCSDLNGLCEVLPNMTDEGWINWDKHSKVANHIWSVKRFMRARFIFKPVPDIRDYIANAEIWDGEKTVAAIAKLRDNQNITKESEPSQTREKSEKKEKVKMTERDWQILNAGSETKKYSSGETILPLGVVNRHLFRIKKGSVRVEKMINGQLTVIARMKEKEMFGEISMLLRSEQGTTTAAIVADESTEIIKYKTEFVMDMCKAEPELSEKLNKILSIKLAERLRNFGSKKKEEGGSDEKKEQEDTPPPVKEKKSKSESLAATTITKSASKRDDKKSDKKEDNLPPPRKQIEKRSSMLMGTKKNKKDRNVDEELRKSFNLPEEEVLARSFNCAMKSTITAHGVLYLTQKYICFSATVFGKKTKEKFQLSFCEKMEVIPEKKRIDLVFVGKPISFKDFENIDEVSNMINSFWEQAKIGRLDKMPASGGKMAPETLVEVEDDNGLEPSTADWNNILEGTRKVRYNKDEAIIRQGESKKPRLFQIEKGTCRIEKEIDGNVIVVGTIGEQSITGEISFLEGSGATASVISNTDDTTVLVIEGFFLDVLFEYFPGLSGRFYHFIATVLSTRLKAREMEAAGLSIERKQSFINASDVSAEEETEQTEVTEDDRTDESSTGSLSPTNLLVQKAQSIDKESKRRKSSKKLIISGSEQPEKDKKDKKKKKDESESETIPEKPNEEEDK
eukprot:TRINITY_DN2111_c0_g1_i1.p1 TRINITY_DN2111_c0_g1~~TRINITY_DN2111_c0_g1_i1.p1  ORF type:complete len:1230 (-),score=380.39 TRINITY_DN2111_c0_g1_i1:146-3835(-)